MKIILTTIISLSLPLFGFGQYHSLEMPQASPQVEESQKLGITTIQINYSSPAVKGRDIWGPVVPMNGDPIPWRIGANMNTTISFSTDVSVDGQPLAAGSYGLHAIPGQTEWTLLFAKNDNLWGSYYLDTIAGIALSVKARPEQIPHSEHLDFEFKNRTDSSLQLAIEWEKVSVPITIGVDLKKTTVAHLRYQLLGASTYAWEAWDAAAQWCLDHSTNLEEALAWSERSISGGYNGYAAQTNFTCLSTKSFLQWALGQKKAADMTMKQAIPLMKDVVNDYWIGKRLSDQGRADLSLAFFNQMIEKFPEVWYVYLGAARATSLNGNHKKAVTHIKKSMSLAPANYQEYLQGLVTKLSNGENI